ncbi:MAG: glycosyltransferase family 2 protein [Candidatus Nitricoxidivorans perseverans]|uniref:Glycosyltransferase family 2 protein n=1 Tax=Candidatus Nitricoxidivorans perseverans TaxID=2975601 RepID=A0AA49IUX7_9PROT|nr:MAG: glycosyltransferase family 2 protein [Candidatus Nitricoxidivorans perseverans]
MMPLERPRVLAVVVTFFPKAELLGPLLDQLSAQCAEVLIVDNTPAARDDVFAMTQGSLAVAGNCRLMRFGRNLGIAAALNAGIDVALAEHFEYVLLSDQDSLPALDMVAGLVRSERELSALGQPVGAVGPLIRDLVTSQDYPFQAPIPGKLFYGHRFPAREAPYVASSSIITSGMLIPAAALRDVGGMAEGFFIDNVDIEWCHRAIARSYRIFGTGEAVLFHRMGDDCLRIWNFGWRRVSGYGPFRLYFRFRNFVHLLRLSHVPAAWKVRASWYMLGTLYAHAVYSHRRLASLRAIAWGIWDGVAGRLGPPRRY